MARQHRGEKNFGIEGFRDYSLVTYFLSQHPEVKRLCSASEGGSCPCGTRTHAGIDINLKIYLRLVDGLVVLSSPGPRWNRKACHWQKHGIAWFVDEWNQFLKSTRCSPGFRIMGYKTRNQWFIFRDLIRLFEPKPLRHVNVLAPFPCDGCSESEKSFIFLQMWTWTGVISIVYSLSAGPLSQPKLARSTSTAR
jgi:hypothetical protein